MKRVILALAWVFGVLAGLARAVRAKFRRHYDLGTVLLMMGVMEESHLKAAVKAQDASGSMKLGEAAVSIGAITEDHLREALRYQKRLRNGEQVKAAGEILLHNTRSAMRRVVTPSPKVIL